MNSKIKNAPWALLVLALVLPATGFAANEKNSNQPNGKPFTSSETDIHYPNGKPFSGDAINTNYLNGKPFQVEPVTLVMGVQRNVHSDDLEDGWGECKSVTYDTIPDWNEIINTDCTKGKLMLACRETDSNILLVAAQGERSDVLYDTGYNDFDTHLANGVQWYFNLTKASWGFAAADAEVVYKWNCDRVDTDGENRLCWNLGDEGFRCGDSTDLKGPEYERVIYQAD